jgi:aldehyde dehydrogenase (NAD+)
VSDVVEAPAAPSVELGRRAAQRADSRMLIDGELVAAASGAEFDNNSPATGSVLGSTAATGPDDMGRAIASARRAFDDTDWS